MQLHKAVGMPRPNQRLSHNRDPKILHGKKYNNTIITIWCYIIRQYVTYKQAQKLNTFKICYSNYNTTKRDIIFRGPKAVDPKSSWREMLISLL